MFNSYVKLPEAKSWLVQAEMATMVGRIRSDRGSKVGSVPAAENSQAWCHHDNSSLVKLTSHPSNQPLIRERSPFSKWSQKWVYHDHGIPKISSDFKKVEVEVEKNSGINRMPSKQMLLEAESFSPGGASMSQTLSLTAAMPLAGRDMMGLVGPWPEAWSRVRWLPFGYD